jgi:hypothetical protein
VPVFPTGTTKVAQMSFSSVSVLQLTPITNVDTGCGVLNRQLRCFHEPKKKAQMHRAAPNHLNQERIHQHISPFIQQQISPFIQKQIKFPITQIKNISNNIEPLNNNKKKSKANTCARPPPPPFVAAEVRCLPSD